MTLQRERPLHVRQQISNTMKGRTLSDETKQKISQTMKKNWERCPKQSTETLWGQSNNNQTNQYDHDAD